MSVFLGTVGGESAEWISGAASQLALLGSVALFLGALRFFLAKRVRARFLLAAGLPQPVLQHEVTAAGQQYRIDVAYPEHRVGIEYDGEEFHSTPRQLDADRRRQRHLARAGWSIIRLRMFIGRSAISRWPEARSVTGSRSDSVAPRYGSRSSIGPAR